MAQLWLLVGGNGAGKSTFYERLLAPRGIRLVNADRIARALDSDAPEGASYQAARIADRIRERLLAADVSFCFETVFSHPSKIDFVAEARALGYEIILVFIHLDTPDLHAARVAQRVDDGGHDVPEIKIRSRLPRTLRHVEQVLPLVDEVHLLDNSSSEDPFVPVAAVVDNRLRVPVEPLPEWAVSLLRDYLVG